MNQNRSKKGGKKKALERVDIERGRGQMSTEQAAFLLPALLPAGLPSQAPFLAVHCDTKLVVPQ